MKAYHGSAHEIILKERPMYFSLNIVDARKYAIGKTDAGYCNEKSFVYEIEIPDELIEIEENFEDFDVKGYLYDTEWADDGWDVIFNKEYNHLCVRNPIMFPFNLIENFENKL